MADSSDDSPRMTELLKACSHGEPEALSELMSLAYTELRRQAHAYFKSERRNHTLQTAALVNEVYLRLAAESSHNWTSREEFQKIAAFVMQEVLIQHARAKNRLKRPPESGRVDYLELEDPAAKERKVKLKETTVNFVELYEVLKKLAKLDKILAETVVRRYFGGQTIEETAEAMNTSEATVKRNWEIARTWLHREMSR